MIRFCLFALFAVSVLFLPVAAAERPNIVLVMADDQGWGDMGYNGHPKVKTPNFDESAATGIRFDRFYAAAPVCSPTRASVLTGRNPNRLGVYQWGYPIRKQETTLPEILRDAGYTTGHFGKWHLGSVRNASESKPGEHGFDRWVSAPNFYDNGATLSDEGTAVSFEGKESSYIAVDSALEWMKESLEGDKPIFAVIWFGSPHHPHIASDEDGALYENEAEKEKQFLGELTGMDRAYGKLKGELAAMGIRDNTLLWYCSDNGALKGIGRTGGFRGHKGMVYEGGLLVPSIIEWPNRFPEHQVVEARGNTFDILPTVLEAAGVDDPKVSTRDGHSLLGLVEGNSGKRERPMGFWHTETRGIGTPSEEWMQELLAAQKNGQDLPPNKDVVAAMSLPDPPQTIENLRGHAAWIDGDWKLHRIVDKKKKTVTYELYDLGKDPFEEQDVFSANPKQADKMKRALDQWMSSVVGSLNGADY